MSLLPTDVWWTIGTFLQDSTFIVLFHTSKFISQSLGCRKHRCFRQRMLNRHEDERKLYIEGKICFRETLNLYRWSIRMKYLTDESHQDIEDMVKKNLNIEFYKLAISVRDHVYKDDSEACNEAIKLGRFDIFCLIYDERLKMEWRSNGSGSRLSILKRGVALIEDIDDYDVMLHIIRLGKSTLFQDTSDDHEKFENFNDRNDEKDLEDMSESEEEDYWRRI